MLRPGVVVDVWATFDEGGGYKRRPAVVLRSTRHEVEVVLCTTSARASQRRGAMAMHDPRGAGLARLTTVMTGKRVTITRPEILGVWGTCGEPDWQRIVTMLGTAAA